MKFGIVSIRDGADISEKEFKSKLAKSGYKGSVNKAWAEWSAKFPPKKVTKKVTTKKSEPKKED